MFVPSDLQDFTFAAAIGPVTATASGLAAPIAGEELRIDVVRADILRLRIGSGGVADAGSAVRAAAVHPAPVFAVAGERSGAVRLTTDRLLIEIERAPLAIRAWRPDGSPVFATASDPDGAPLVYGRLNDGFAVVRRCAPADPVFGLGQKSGPGNRRGRRFLLWNTDVLAQNDPAVAALWPFAASDPPDPTDVRFDPYYVSIPFFHHLDAATGAAVGHFFDNPYPAYFDFAEADRYAVRFAGGILDEYVLAGPSFAEIAEGYTWLTGRVPPPPVWALGHHQCRWHRHDERSLLDLARRYREREIPCDSLWLDIDYMDGYRVFTWNRALFPDPPAMLAKLAGQGFRAVTIIDPGVKAEPGYPVFDEGVAGDHFCRTEGGAVYTGQVWPGRAAFPDFSLPEARKWWAERIAAFVGDGPAGIWIDMNEPSTGRIDGLAMRFGRGRLAHDAYHNRYANGMAEATWEGLRAARPKERPFVLSRAGAAGIQRHAATWLGDNCARWAHLALSLPMAAGLAISGQPFVGADVGGFAEACSGELLARWYQAAALMPFFRNHNCDAVDQYPWSFGDQWERVCREAVRLRYRLMPYLYTAFLTAVETGEPVLKPLVYGFQDDPRTWAIDDQFLLGDRLLAAPVCSPNRKERSVYVPAGAWRDWISGELRTGPTQVEVAAAIDQVPLFVGAGAVIPLWPEAPATTLGYQPEVIELAVFVPVADGVHRSRLDEDDGISVARLSGSYLRTELILERAGAKLRLAGRVGGDGYPEFRRRRFHVRLVGGEAAACGHRGESVTAAASGVFVVDNRGEDFEVEFSLSGRRRSDPPRRR
jgi:alpha-glucosidase